MAAAKANFAALAKLVADVLVSGDDDGEMSDLHLEEELEETSDLAVVAMLVAKIIREDRHRVRLYVESVVDSYNDKEFRRLFRLQRPTDCEEDYYNSNEFHSIILQAVCDADMVFFGVFVGFPGRAHDARVLEESFLFEEAASRFDGEQISNIQSNKIAISTVLFG
ncbi:hypothetical protein MRX96_007007 [Rhipicephalus microplus]